jgi:hypothetical protein
VTITKLVTDTGEATTEDILWAVQDIYQKLYTNNEDMQEWFLTISTFTRVNKSTYRFLRK